MKPQPPDDAYSRVTNPERFRVLHTVADGLVERLGKRFAVTVTDGQADAWDGWAVSDIARVVLVRPEDPQSASITIAYSGFPGLMTRLGRWTLKAYPVCGCDACDDDPNALAESLLEQVEAVTEGRFVERRSQDGLYAEFTKVDGGWSRSGSVFPKDDPRRMDPPAVIKWAPWPRRSAVLG